MKKIVAVVLAGVLCLSFAACSKTESDPGDAAEVETKDTNEKNEHVLTSDGKNIITGYKSGDVTLGKYTGLTYTPLSVEVTEEEVNAKFDQYVDSYKSKVEVTDRDVVQNGDLVDVNFEGLIDGEAFKGGTGRKEALKIGSGTFIQEFEEALIGKTKGTSFQINVTFPKDYNNTELAGKPAVFNITLNGIYIYEYPEATDAFVAEKTSNKYTTIEAYKENIRNQIKEQKEEEAEIQKQYDVVKKLIENTTYNIDMEAEIVRGMNSIRSYNDDAIMSAYGMDSAGYYRTYLGIDEEQYKALLRSEAELSVRYEYARSAIVEAEKFVVTDEEIDKLGTSMMSQYGFSSLEDFCNRLKELNGVDGRVYLAEQVRLNKAGDLILDTAIPEK